MNASTSTAGGLPGPAEHTLAVDHGDHTVLGEPRWLASPARPITFAPALTAS